MKFMVWDNTRMPTSVDECQLDIDKMILHVLDCLGALQCVIGEYDATRAKVFWGAVATIAEIGIDQTVGHVDRRHPGGTHLLRSFPNEQIGSERKDWLPLHWAAVTDTVDVNDIRSIARADPLATMKGLNQPMNANPVHMIAAARHPNMEVVRCLHNFFPRMACSKDFDGDLPLHYAARYTESVEVIEFLLQAYPTATQARGVDNLIPLHNALYNESLERSAIAKCLIDADPSSASLCNLDGDTCFHIAIDQECGQDVLHNLIQAFPEGILTANDMGYLPLHLACLSKDSPRNHEVVDLLLRAKKDAVRLPSTAGHLPIHIAAEHSTEDVLQSVVNAYPDSVYSVCSANHNNTPLMIAIGSGNEACVNFLCDHYPESAKCINSAGLNPMHAAVEGDSLSILRKVFDTNPDVIRQIDLCGRLPLHVFMQVHQDLVGESSSEVDCLRFLLKHYPEAVNIEDASGETSLSLCPQFNKVFRRLLLRQQPSLYVDEFRALNYENRRMAMFLAFVAINADGFPNIFLKLRAFNGDALRVVMSFL
jgi:ankyrin repeat protein